MWQLATSPNVHGFNIDGIPKYLGFARAEIPFADSVKRQGVRLPLVDART